MRSCLDYLAHDIFEYIYPSENLPARLYFPIQKKQNDFDKAIDKDYKKLKELNHPMYEIIENIQPYKLPWLGNFSNLTNYNKHQNLTVPKKDILVEKDNKKVSWDDGVIFEESNITIENGSTLTIGSDATVIIGDNGISIMDIPININTQLPEENTDATINIVFSFQGTNETVVDFIDKSINNIEQLCDNVYIAMETQLTT